MRGTPLPRTLAGLLLLAVFTTALAGYKAGLKAYESGEYEKAFDALRPAAEKGEAHAQYLMGEMYRLGRGASTNPEKAAGWYRKAAAQGHPDAQFQVAAMSRAGSVDDEEALRWYQAAAAQGHRRAQHNLGNLYDEGVRVPQDRALALHWFRTCAELEDADCQSHVGRMYAEGHGVERDDETAIRWLERSAMRGDREGQDHLAQMYLRGQGVPRDPQMALTLLERSVEQDFLPARITLAELYTGGEDVARDGTKALALAAESAALGDREAREAIDSAIDVLTEEELREASGKLVESFRSGKYSAAALIAKLLAHRGDKAAQLLLGRMYALSYGAPQNLPDAYLWLRLGEEHDPVVAAELLRRIEGSFNSSEMAAIGKLVETWKPTPWRTGDEEMRELPIVGQNGVTEPRRFRYAAPDYPEPARVERAEGTVILQALITEGGQVADLFVLSSDRPGLGFEEEALAAVARWGYDPATLDGKAVEVRFTIRVDYRLK